MSTRPNKVRRCSVGILQAAIIAVSNFAPHLTAPLRAESDESITQGLYSSNDAIAERAIRQVKSLGHGMARAVWIEAAIQARTQNQRELAISLLARYFPEEAGRKFAELADPTLYSNPEIRRAALVAINQLAAKTASRRYLDQWNHSLEASRHDPNLRPLVDQIDATIARRREEGIRATLSGHCRRMLAAFSN